MTIAIATIKHIYLFCRNYIFNDDVSFFSQTNNLNNRRVGMYVKTKLNYHYKKNEI